MNHEVKYSVIIPIYNAEKTLRRCLDSLVCQLRSDIEILLVNDGSLDSSLSIASEYAAKYPAFQVINQKNKGVSCARNAGLDAAVGQYVLFIDSDDYVREDYFYVLDQCNDLDLIVFCHEILGNDSRDMAVLFSQLQQLETDSQRLELLLMSRRIMSPGDKRFLRSLIESHKLRFCERLSIGEDFNFCMAYAVHCSTIGIAKDKIIFIDTTSTDSLSRKYRPELCLQMFQVYSVIQQTLLDSPMNISSKDNLLAIADYLYVKNTFSCIAEEFKRKKIHYLKDRKQIHSICQTFQVRLSDRRVNLIHFMLRFALKWNMFFPFYIVAYLVKGRKYSSYRKK